MSDQDPYRMSISLNVLNHLGMNLYSNIPAVLSEIVANAWDADATIVEIKVDAELGEIVIVDDGVGMDRNDINERFLKVGYDKRGTTGDKSSIHQRDVMGRKGIGKLAVFSIASIVDVFTVKGSERNALSMSAIKIREHIMQGKPGEYTPDALDTADLPIQQGTMIVLRGLKKEVDRSIPYLRRRLARRFSIIGSTYSFHVFINGEEITSKDRQFYDHIQFIWYLGKESKHYVAECPKVNQGGAFEESGVVDADADYTVQGWIGTVDEPRRIGDSNNAIVIYAHGKLIQEDILKDFNKAALYSEYLIGEIDADFMDITGQDDIVTSDRQRINETDPRYVALYEYVRRLLTKIEGKWSELRRKHSLNRALDIPAVKTWYEALQGDSRKYAEGLFGKIESFRLKDIGARKELYKYAILAFERMSLEDSLSLLDRVETDRDLDLVLEVFKGIDRMEAVLYHQIVRERLRVIKVFKDMVPHSQERVIQQYLFDHLWLLDPSWERASTDADIEKTFKKAFPSMTDNLTEEQAEGRYDIRYRTAAGKHIIIELKKYDRKVDVYELMRQAGKYVSALQICLDRSHSHEPVQIECICIVGSKPRSDGIGNIDQQLATVKTRYITYDDLIRMSLESYNDYLEKDKEVSRVLAAVAAVEAASFGDDESTELKDQQSN